MILEENLNLGLHRTFLFASNKSFKSKKIWQKILWELIGKSTIIWCRRKTQNQGHHHLRTVVKPWQLDTILQNPQRHRWSKLDKNFEKSFQLRRTDFISNHRTWNSQKLSVKTPVIHKPMQSDLKHFTKPRRKSVNSFTSL